MTIIIIIIINLISAQHALDIIIITSAQHTLNVYHQPALNVYHQHEMIIIITPPIAECQVVRL